MPPLAFLVPAFLAGVLAVVIPILVHLTRKQRSRVEPFPSLMFLEKVPFQAESRRKIHHWFLLFLRALAVALVVGAFARPFLDRSELSAGTVGGPREVVILLDRSWSMEALDRWDRAVDAAREVVGRLGPLDRASLVLFARSASVAVRSTADRSRLLAALDTARPGSEGTRYAPGLKLAQAILEETELPAGELVMVGDFQRVGWSGEEGVRLPAGTVVTPVAVGGGGLDNLAVAGVTLSRQRFSGRERVTPTVRVTRVGGDAPRSVEAVLELDGREAQRREVTLPANGAAQVAFQPLTLEDGHTRGSVRVGDDPLARDNVHHFVLTPGTATGVLLVGEAGGGGAGASRSVLYLRRALEISDEGSFDVALRAGGPSAEDLRGRRVVVLHDRPFPSGAEGRALRAFVEGGGGLVVALGERSAWPADQADLLPGRLGAALDRSGERGSRLGALDHDHEVFEVFAGPRSGDFTSARFFRARALDVADEEGVRVVARFDDGSVALAERRVGEGRVLVWTSTLDAFWNDLALQPVFLPFVHQLVRHASGRAESVPWFVAGQVLDVTDARAMATAGLGDAALALAEEAERVAISPSGTSLPLASGEGPHFLALEEQGFYEIRRPGSAAGRPLAVAVNVELEEADLTPLDVAEVVASIGSGPAAPEASGARPGGRDLGREDQERRQSLWRLLLVAAFIVLAVETAVSNRISAASARRGVHARAS